MVSGGDGACVWCVCCVSCNCLFVAGCASGLAFDSVVCCGLVLRLLNVAVGQ